MKLTKQQVQRAVTRAVAATTSLVGAAVAFRLMSHPAVFAVSVVYLIWAYALEQTRNEKESWS